MNITEFMSFDLDFFMTLPGILVTSGVVILLVALIVFIVSNKKNKKSANAAPVENVAVAEQPIVDNNINMPVADLGNMGVQTNMPVNDFSQPINNEPFVPSNPNVNITGNIADAGGMVAIPSVTDNGDNAMNSQPEVSNYSATPATNVVDFSIPMTQNSVSTTTNESVVSTPETAPVVDIPSVTPATDLVPNVTESQQPVQPEPIVDIPAVEPKPVIYGGVDPSNTIVKPEGPKPIIYGGANPLENTTTIPNMTNHDVYHTNQPVETSVSEPAVPNEEKTLVIETPTVESTDTPAVEPTMPMTGAEMFNTTDNNTAKNASPDELETLDF